MRKDRKPRDKPIQYIHLWNLILTKEERIYNVEKTFSSISSDGKTGSMHKRMKLEHFLTPYIKINGATKDRPFASAIIALVTKDQWDLWCWRRLLRVPWVARRSNQSIL